MGGGATKCAMPWKKCLKPIRKKKIVVKIDNHAPPLTLRKISSTPNANQKENLK